MEHQVKNQQVDEEFIRKVENEYDYLRFTTIDFHGICRNKSYPRSQFRQIFEDGFYTFSGLSGWGINGDLLAVRTPKYVENFGNFKCVPKPETLHPLLLKSDKFRVGEVFCQILLPDGQPMNADPRGILEMQLDRLSQMGFRIKSAWEVEYTVVNAKTEQPKFLHTTYALTGRGVDLFGDVCYELEDALKKSDVAIEAFMTEAGPGQLEFIMSPVLGIKAADDLIMLKDVVRDVHAKHGDKAIFMTKPFAADFCNGFHFNHSLLDVKGGNVFSDVSRPNRLSDVWKHWLAGLIKHTRALTALMCPTVNCYRRLHGFAVPSKADWGIDNRLATFRVKNFSPSGSFIENRIPSGSCNPYLVIAGLVAAGIDGLKNKFELPSALEAGEDEDVEALPHTLQEALAALKEDKQMVGALGEEFVDWFIETKNVEVNVFKDFEPKKDDEEMYAEERAIYMDVI